MTSLSASETFADVRSGILVLAFIPYIYFAKKDAVFHFRGRKVGVTEHILHAAITLLLVIMFAQAIRAHHVAMTGALVLFAVAGGIDEYIYHHEIPTEESDLHAKGHLALLLFVIVSLATDWLQKNGWSIPQAMNQLLATP